MAAITVPRKVKQQVVMRAETVYGSDAIAGTYLVTDIIQAISTSVRYSPQIEEIPNLATAGALGRLPSAIGTRTGTLTFDMAARGRGVAYSASVKPETDLPLRGAGHEAILADGVSYTYRPTDDAESLTIYVVQEIPGTSGQAVAAKLVGCVGSVRWTARAGGPGRWTFTFQGGLVEEADLTYVQPVIIAEPSLPTLRSANFHLGAYGPCVDTLSFDQANELNRVPCANHVAGIEGFQIVDREPMVEADPQMDLEANSGIWDSMEDGDPLQTVGWVLGQTAFNKLEFHIAADDSPGGQYVAADWTERDGVATRQLRIRATLRDGPNTDYKFVYS